MNMKNKNKFILIRLVVMKISIFIHNLSPVNYKKKKKIQTKTFVKQGAYRQILKKIK